MRRSGTAHLDEASDLKAPVAIDGIEGKVTVEIEQIVLKIGNKQLAGWLQYGQQIVDSAGLRGLLAIKLPPRHRGEARQ